MNYWLRHVRPSVRMEHLGSHWKDFREIWFECFPKVCREKIKVSLESDKIIGALQEGQPIFARIFFSSS
jgi:hypothetical protein